MTNKLRIKKGDSVKVLSGKDKGKTGKVLRVLPALGKLVVEGVGIHTKFEKSRRAGQPGQRIEASSPISVSKVMLIDSHSGRPTRVGYQTLDNGTKQRVAKVSGKAV